MDSMLPTTLGKLKILCALPFFSDAVCIRSQSAAEHAFTNILLTIALTSKLAMPDDLLCEAIELAIFAEVPKAYLGDPSFYLRKRHPEVQKLYKEVHGRLWLEAEAATGLSSSRDPFINGLHNIVDAFSARLFIEKESILGNGYFQAERFRTHYHLLRKRALAQEDLTLAHDASFKARTDLAKNCCLKSNNLRGEEFLRRQPFVWLETVKYLDSLFDEASRALSEEGIGAYSATFLGMIEKLKEHFRYKGWTYHHRESVGEHTFQVIFICRLLAELLQLGCSERISLYRAAAFHDLAEAYASDVVYPVKIREKDLGEMHAAIEKKVLEAVTASLGFQLPKDRQCEVLVDIADRFSAQIYFDRERRSGNKHFDVENISMLRVKEKYGSEYPNIFSYLEELWKQYELSVLPRDHENATAHSSLS